MRRGPAATGLSLLLVVLIDVACSGLLLGELRWVVAVVGGVLLVVPVVVVGLQLGGVVGAAQHLHGPGGRRVLHG
ncbi:hypothetical protein QT196_39250 (plasmid) [Streptomyces sp. P9-2B-2]|uniref:hypothetical protein n=1 Tax=Streptomyces sp. P9-2B-2 TaxID=3057114 RepID=UPI0025B4A40F|nr:hypothetical protein [Streptomyces sp. P9-2B-2]WJY43295.1 hypothetical protein QT196_39250 [Streptomyces sp. P9-2B-2]